jgi:hypothetical protein
MERGEPYCFLGGGHLNPAAEVTAGPMWGEPARERGVSDKQMSQAYRIREQE